MTLFSLFLLAIIQGLTEFLPISSSAHLALLHQVTGTSTSDVALDVAVHLGSILAVIVYFHAESAAAGRGLGDLLRGRRQSADAQLARNLLLGTVPLIVAGAIIVIMGWEDALRDIRVIGWTMIIFGILLWWMDRAAPQTLRAPDWTLRRALIMGLWQALALIPGVSRSGITITGARAIGLERRDATRLSMLMSIPATLATGAVLAIDVVQAEAGIELLGRAAFAALFAFAAAWFALCLMMRFLDRVSFTPYVVYRIALGVLLLALAYG
ncbi:MAG: undecaprenyl-diphosphate phosphatase [Roseovarius sp.]|uniref:undecaprenyl-diphosphate phosphatase n=1 Tax=Roseovarius sp. TaxID=1486281 RepID=UPI004059CBE8